MGAIAEQPNDPYLDGYEFSHWFVLGTDIEFAFTTTLYVDTVLVAYFAPLTGPTFTISFEGVGIEPFERFVPVGSFVSKPDVPTRDGFVFAHWVHNDLPFDFSLKPESDITLVASWNPIVGPEMGDIANPSTAIATRADFASLVLGHTSGNAFHLTDNIDFTDFTWPAHGNRNFDGTLDGRGFALINITQPDTLARGGIFNEIRGTSVIRNIRIINANITTNSERAGIFGNRTTNTANITFSNITIVDSHINGQHNEGVGTLLGSFAGTNLNVSNVYIVNSTLRNRNRAVGSLVGRMNPGANATVSISNINVVNTTLTANGADGRVGGVFGELANAADDTITISNIVMVGVTLIGATRVAPVIGEIANSSVPADEDYAPVTISNVFFQGLMTGRTDDESITEAGTITQFNGVDSFSNVWVVRTTIDGTLTDTVPQISETNRLDDMQGHSWWVINLPGIAVNNFAWVWVTVNIGTTLEPILVNTFVLAR